MMIESIFSFFYLLYHFFSPNVKSVNLLVASHSYRTYWPVRLKDFKSNIYVEQSDEIVSTFLHVDTRNFELVEKCWVGGRNWLWDTGHKVNGKMNG